MGGYLRAPVGRPWWCGLEGRDWVSPRSPGHSPDTCHKLGQGLKSEQDLSLDSLMKENQPQTSTLEKSYINIGSCMVLRNPFYSLSQTILFELWIPTSFYLYFQSFFYLQLQRLLTYHSRGYFDYFNYSYRGYFDVQFQRLFWLTFTDGGYFDCGIRGYFN